MRILIFQETILPPAYLPRVRYFCSFFQKKGWKVDLVTESSDYLKFAPENVSLFPIDYYKNKQGAVAKAEWVFKFLLNLFWDYKGNYFYRKSQHFIKDKKYDIVFCSSCFTFPLTVTAKVAKERNLPLFVDLRDIAEQSPDDNHYLAQKPPTFFGNLIIDFYKKINLKRRNNVLEKSTGVTTISPWHVQTLSKYNERTYLIYNGFDENKFVPENKTTDRFTLSYFGRIYNEQMRNPGLVLKAVQQLHLKKILSPENTAIKWYIDESSEEIIRKIAKEYDLELFMEYHSFIEPDNLSDEMNKSSILLVLGNIITNKRYFGIMTTKFFEAIGNNRPLICTPDNQDSLSELIKSTNCGMVTSDPTEIEDFLLVKFKEWQTQGNTQGTLSDELRMNFSRKKGAEKLEQLFLDAIKKKQQ